MVRVFYSESDWLHCPKCGEETVEIVKPNGYDASTGRSRTKHYRKCPNGRWWNSGAPSFMGDNADLHLGKVEITYIGPPPSPIGYPVPVFDAPPED